MLYIHSSRIAEFTHLLNIDTNGWRHNHTFMLYEADVSMKEAQLRLGHSSLKMTNSIYTQLSEEQKTAMIKK
ncbi:tyrosine-type recombinase/integrase [Enterococcus faecalis]|uniref:tyrosine-type recombinase/integrase n=1 Tax=Enterococcus faecalis TaxID=1351 RepID=UPI003D78305C